MLNALGRLLPAPQCRRHVHIAGITAHPTGPGSLNRPATCSWISAIAPTGFRFLVRDRDSKVTTSFDAVSSAPTCGSFGRRSQPGAPGSHLACTDSPDERASGSRRAVAAAARIWAAPGIWGSSTATSPTRSRRCRCRSSSSTSTRWSAAAGGARRGPAGRRPTRAGRVRPEPGRVRGLPAGGAVPARAPGGGAAGVADRHGARRSGSCTACSSAPPDCSAQVRDRIAALVVLAHAVCCDETPLQVGPRTSAAGEAQGRAVSAGVLHRPVHPLPAR